MLALVSKVDRLHVCWNQNRREISSAALFARREPSAKRPPNKRLQSVNEKLFTVEMKYSNAFAAYEFWKFPVRFHFYRDAKCLLALGFAHSKMICISSAGDKNSEWKSMLKNETRHSTLCCEMHEYSYYQNATTECTAEPEIKWAWFKKDRERANKQQHTYANRLPHHEGNYKLNAEQGRAAHSHTQRDMDERLKEKQKWK